MAPGPGRYEREEQDAVSTLAELLAEPGSWQRHDAIAAAMVAELGVDPAQAERIATTLADNERSRADGVERLWQLRERMAHAQSLAAMGDFDWHIETDTNTWSDELFRIYGYQPGAVAPSYRVFFDHIHPEDRERVRAAYHACYDTGEPYEMVERIVRPDGTTRYLWTNGEIIHDNDGAPVRMRGTSIDITDQVLAEQAREEAAIRLGDARLRRRQATEINDNVVQGLTAAIYALELDDQPRVSRYLRQTLESASRMMSDLLDQDAVDLSADRALVRSTPASLEVLDALAHVTEERG